MGVRRVEGENNVLLTDEEQTWVKTVVRHLAQAGEQTEMLETVQLSLLCKGDGKVALKRLQKMNKWRTKYDLESVSIHDAFHYSNERNQQCQVMGKDKEGRETYYYDYGQFNPSLMKNDKKQKQAFMRMAFAMNDAATCDLEKIRKGITFVALLRDLSSKNVDIFVEKEMAEFYQDGYPMKLSSVCMVEPPAMIRGVMNLLSMFLKKKLRERIQMFKTKEECASQWESDVVCPALGGETEMNVLEWINENNKVRAETEASLLQQYGANFAYLLDPESAPATPSPTKHTTIL
eukprot:m.334989 g.334989  ORF g.334989 m.334989 type:complete len:291 (-) comp17488_c0_seq1:183-1055(-)